MQAGKKKTEFEVRIMECLMDRAEGLKKGVHKSLKVVKHEGRVTNRSPQNFETKKIEGATTIGAGSMMQVRDKDGRRSEKGKVPVVERRMRHFSLLR